MSDSAFTSPDVIMFIPAVILDIIGIVLVCFLLDDFGITDLIGFAIFVPWSWFRSKLKEGGESNIDFSRMKERRKQFKELKSSKTETEAVKTSKVSKWLKRAKFLEFIPYLGALPLWTISLYAELKED